MDLVSNFVGIVSPSLFGENNTQGISQGYDLGDKTFADLLEKQMRQNIEQNKPNFIETLGLPTGFNITDLIDSQNQTAVNTENAFDKIKAVNETENQSMTNLSTKKENSTSEVLTFFNSLFDSKPTLTDTSKSNLFDLERRIAAGSYGKYAKNIVTNLGEFVTDTLKLNS